MTLEQPAPGEPGSPGGSWPARDPRAASRVVERRALPLDASISPAKRGWRIRLTLRGEDVRVDKRVVVAERVVVGRHQVTDVARYDAEAQREQLLVDEQGAAETTR